MKLYQLQRMTGDESDPEWGNVGPPNQSIKYMRGLQDGLDYSMVYKATRIVEIRNGRYVTMPQRSTQWWKTGVR
jgi:hypothetical protein